MLVSLAAILQDSTHTCPSGIEGGGHLWREPFVDSDANSSTAGVTQHKTEENIPPARAETTASYDVCFHYEDLPSADELPNVVRVDVDGDGRCRSKDFLSFNEHPTGSIGEYLDLMKRFSVDPLLYKLGYPSALDNSLIIIV